MLDEDAEITVDGTTGDVYLGSVPTIEARAGRHFTTLMGWVDEIRTLGVWANADTAEDAARAIELGADGIGLCRTEHMFFAPRRILAMREMILASDETERRRALERIEPMQRRDFARMLRAMKGRPVTVRLLDPPLHEFLPVEDAEIEAIAADLHVRPAEVRRKAEALREINPMLGHRGCRLGITFPEIYRAQTRAMYGAACDVVDDGVPVRPEVMIPLAMEAEELRRLRELVVGDRGRGAARARTRPADRGRHHDRAAARGAARRRAGAPRRLLQLRHQRPDADDDGPLARRRGPVPPGLRGAGDPPRRSVQDASTRPASASWWRWGAGSGARRTRASPSASAASRAAIPARSSSFTASASTT